MRNKLKNSDNNFSLYTFNKLTSEMYGYKPKNMRKNCYKNFKFKSIKFDKNISVFKQKCLYDKRFVFF